MALWSRDERKLQVHIFDFDVLFGGLHQMYIHIDYLTIFDTSKMELFPGVNNSNPNLNV